MKTKTGPPTYNFENQHHHIAACNPIKKKILCIKLQARQHSLHCSVYTHFMCSLGLGRTTKLQLGFKASRVEFLYRENCHQTSKYFEKYSCIRLALG